jgi:hypothetical protein
VPAELLDGDDVLSAEASDDDPACLGNDRLVAGRARASRSRWWEPDPVSRTPDLR